MPELPEVETIRKSLSSRIKGKKILSVEILEKKQFTGDLKDIIGKRITDLSRWGKVLIIKLDNGKFINFHLKMSGEILYAKNSKHAVFKNNLPRSKTNKLPNQHTRCVIYLNDGSAIFFNDLRKFGWIKVTPKPEGYRSPDILSKEFTLTHLKKIVSSSRKPIKPVLMDQEKLAGLGNIYTNDALWEAYIHPTRPANSLTEMEIKKLYKGILKTINEGLKYKGSSAKDEMYVMPDSSKGGYQYHFKVYHRVGEPCLRDKTPIKGIRLGGRGTFFCPKCQR